MKPIYKHLRFKTKEDFNVWLKETTWMRITLEDHGQDLQEIHVAKNGEIIHCDFQASVWNGSFVDLDTVSPCNNLVIINDHLEDWTATNFIIDEIINS